MGATRGNFLDLDTDTLTGVTLALKKVDKEAKKEWARSMRTTGTRVWRSAVRNRMQTRQDRAMFGRASVRWSQGGKGVAVVATKTLSGGAGGSGAPGPLTLDFGDKDGRYGSTAGTAPWPRYKSQGRVVHGALYPFGRYMGQMSLKVLADEIRDAAGVD